MPRLNLMSLSLVGILFAAAQVSAQEESHVLTQESAADVEPVPAPPAVAQEREEGSAGNPGRQGYADGAGRAPAPRPVVRDPRNGRVVAAPPVVYNGQPNRYVYSGRYIPSRPVVYGSGYLYYGPGFGYFGPGFGVYYGNYYGYYGGYFGWPGYYSAPVSAPVDDGRTYDTGELRLQVSPRTAKVFVDGGYAGTVDDYDGTFQSLKLESGSYAIRLEAPGYQTIEFDVRITPSQKLTYRETLRPE